MARTLIFNYKKNKEIVLNQWEHNETIVKFEGYQKVNANEVIYFILRTNDFKMDLPLDQNNQVTIQQPMVVKSGEFRGQLCRCLVTTNEDDEEVLELLDTNPPTFKVTVLRRMRPEQDTEIEDVTLDLWAQDMQTLYNQTNTLKTTIQTKLQNGEFKGEKGDKGDTGSQGPKGDTGQTGPAGSDASVTSTNIISALGYTPANDETSAKKSDLLQKQDKLIAGDNITIASDGKTISATDTVYDDTEVRNLIAGKQNTLTDSDKQSITKTGMTSGSDWTSTEQANARKRIGLDKEWVLVSTITDNVWHNVDLTEKTEIIIVSRITASATGNIMCTLDGSSYAIVQGASYNGTRTMYAHFADSFLGFECIDIRSVNNDSSSLSQQSAYPCIYIGDLHISNITRFAIGGTSKSAELKIYAR